MPPQPAASNTLVTLQFLGMGLIWGSSFLFIKIALDGVSFGQVAWSRLVLGGLTLGLIVLVNRPRVNNGPVLPREGVVWLHFLVIAITGCVIPHLLFAWAEQYVSSSLASIYNAVTPIMTALLATLAFRVEKFVRAQVAGVMLGIFGVVVIIGPWQYSSLTGDFWGQLACLGAAVSYGFTYGYTRRFLSGRPIAGSTFAFLNIGIGGGIMLLLTPVLAWSPVQLTLPIVLCLLALGALGTGVTYIWNINVLRAWGPTNASTVTYVTPVVGVILGVLVLAETFSWHEPTGALLVLVGILLTQKRLRLGWFGVRGREAAASV
ncbi:MULTISPECIES: DMT family transporter [Cryobacterium]|uniref:Permease of the drug/metabolite transporter (DMT) superfamily n=2 Tax=Cryobacterium levicorallinum TaxID=995038 RepID=A0ABY1E8V3_9MICO|nr:DMT family transporter [Cryobacterium levicorallinum]GEP26089.1 transporter [Cryobacterium levicorallinum]SFH14924.1 Permease of the drug/metabolite transporter (DMT) superfamily [Cryobacterium levicorallinum]